MYSVTHIKISGKTDGPDSTLVRPTDWNNSHKIVTDQQGIVLGRDTSGPGPIQELPLAVAPDGSLALGGTGAFKPPAGTTAQRPAPPQPGSIRYNTDTQTLEIYGLGGTTTWKTVTPWDFVPAGFIAGFAGVAANIPPTWLICDGRAISRTDNAALFAAIGTSWGNGNNTTTFNIPDLKDRVLVGAGGTYAIGPSSADKRGAFNKAVPVPSHTHDLWDPVTNSVINGFPLPAVMGIGGFGPGGSLWVDRVDGPGGSGATKGVIVRAAGDGTQMNVEQPGAAINWAIKT